MLFIVAQITRGLILDPQTQNPPLLVFWLPPLEAHPLLSRPERSWHALAIHSPTGIDPCWHLSNMFCFPQIQCKSTPPKKGTSSGGVEGWLFLNVLNVQRKKNVVGCGVSLRFFTSPRPSAENHHRLEYSSKHARVNPVKTPVQKVTKHEETPRFGEVFDQRKKSQKKPQFLESQPFRWHVLFHNCHQHHSQWSSHRSTGASSLAKLSTCGSWNSSVVFWTKEIRCSL